MSRCHPCFKRLREHQAHWLWIEQAAELIPHCPKCAKVKAKP